MVLIGGGVFVFICHVGSNFQPSPKLKIKQLVGSTVKLRFYDFPAIVVFFLLLFHYHLIIL